MFVESDWIVLGKLLLAIVLGGLIGLERELVERPAGLRTHMLVAASSALLVSLGRVLVLRFAEPELVRSDPIRIIEAIIVGISFLGAGTIFRSHANNETVEGLTTAASILFTAVLGIAVALEQFVIAVGATILVLIINFGLRRLMQQVESRR